MNRCEEILESWSAAITAGEPVPAEVESHLASCADCRTAAAELERVWRRLGTLAEAAPSAVLRRDFEGLLAGYREGLAGRPGADPLVAVEPATSGEATPGNLLHHRAPASSRPAASRRQRTIRRRIYQLGYGLAALLAGFVVGVYARPGAHRGEVAELRGELRAMRQDMALSMLQQTSASARLQGVSVGAQVARQDPEVLGALLETLANDPSPNVRLAAVEALAGRAGEPAVQRGLGEALRGEVSPLVQIALADALLSADGAHARQIVAPLATRPGVRPEVRQYVRQRLGMRT